MMHTFVYTYMQLIRVFSIVKNRTIPTAPVDPADTSLVWLV